jgi:cytochrome c
MFDTMVITKTVAALCGALLVFLLGVWAADGLYQPRNAEAPQAFIIDTGEEEESAEPVEEVTFEDAYAMADADAGSRSWSQCRACHQLEEGANGVGPYLHGVVGREVQAVDGFSYSGALADVVEVWTPEEISKFIENPSDYAPGTSMGYAGLDDVQDRANLIAYIESES